jgi:hypothetical protein
MRLQDWSKGFGGDVPSDLAELSRVQMGCSVGRNLLLIGNHRILLTANDG